MEPRRFSGLIDVRGRKIYEGDIIANVFGAEYNNATLKEDYRQCGCRQQIVWGWASVSFHGFMFKDTITVDHPKLSCGYFYEYVGTDPNYKPESGFPIDFVEKFIKSQVDTPPEFEKVFQKNFDDLLA